MNKTAPTHSLVSLSDNLLEIITEYVPKESKTVKPLRMARGSLLTIFQDPPTFLNRIVKKLPPARSPKEAIELDTKIRQAALQQFNDHRIKFRRPNLPSKPIEILNLSYEEINKLGEAVQCQKDRILVDFFESLCMEYPAIANYVRFPNNQTLSQKAERIRTWIANPENKPLIEDCNSLGFFEMLEQIPPEALAFTNMRLRIHSIPNESLDTLREVLESPQPIDPHQLGALIHNAVTARDCYMLGMVLDAKRPIGFLGAAVHDALNNHSLDMIDRLYNEDQLRNHPCLYNGFSFAVLMDKEEAVQRILRSEYNFTTEQLVSFLSLTSNEAIKAEIQARLNERSILSVSAIKTVSWVRSFFRRYTH